ncbi:hypothetical protein F2Q68_00034324 [Brassica cretica]|uniref:Uncharacterized protein n=1 Tax=Brassica cretica TaxID=69181 RepID=A0A8S9H3N0_BRACR|nr:hypothetical protein F2Q68_00034324 [Brassica cretica]
MAWDALEPGLWFPCVTTRSLGFDMHVRTLTLSGLKETTLAKGNRVSLYTRPRTQEHTEEIRRLSSESPRSESRLARRLKP